MISVTERCKGRWPAVLTADVLRAALEYDPETGFFHWKWRDDVMPKVNGRRAGKRAGRMKPNGYRDICINGVRYYEHRLAWLYMAGRWPAHEVDHRNLKPSDNSWKNLREATPSQNSRNQARKNAGRSGFKGTRQLPSGRWSSCISVDGRQKYLGTFNTAEQAHARYCEEANNLFGEFARFA